MVSGHLAAHSRSLSGLIDGRERKFDRLLAVMEIGGKVRL